MAPGFERRGSKAGHGLRARHSAFSVVAAAELVSIGRSKTTETTTCRSRYARWILICHVTSAVHMAYVSVFNSSRCRTFYLSISISHEIPRKVSESLFRALIGCAFEHWQFHWQRLGHSSAFLLLEGATRDPACRDTHHRNVTRS